VEPHGLTGQEVVVFAQIQLLGLGVYFRASPLEGAFVQRQLLLVQVHPMEVIHLLLLIHLFLEVRFELVLLLAPKVFLLLVQIVILDHLLLKLLLPLSGIAVIVERGI